MSARIQTLYQQLQHDAEVRNNATIAAAAAADQVQPPPSHNTSIMSGAGGAAAGSGGGVLIPTHPYDLSVFLKASPLTASLSDAELKELFDYIAADQARQQKVKVFVEEQTSMILNEQKQLQQQQQKKADAVAAAPTFQQVIEYEGRTIIRKDPPSTMRVGQHLVVCEAEYDRCSTVGAYVLLEDQERCPDPSTPCMPLDKRFSTVVPLHLLNLVDPFYLYGAAEEEVDVTNKVGASWQRACEMFAAASSAFEGCNLARMAANAAIREHDCHRVALRWDDAANCLLRASKLHRQEEDGREARQAALAAMQNAAAIFDQTGRDVTAAKTCREAAELCVKARNPGLGIDILHMCAKTFLEYGQTADARGSLLRAAEIAIMDAADFPEAIDCLEQLAKITPETQQHKVYFRALACRAVCIPTEQGVDTVEAMIDCQKTTDFYVDKCPLFYGSREHRLLMKVMEAQKTLDEDALEKDIARYLEGHQRETEEWFGCVLRRIHRNIITRKLSIEKLYKL